MVINQFIEFMKRALEPRSHPVSDGSHSGGDEIWGQVDLSLSLGAMGLTWPNLSPDHFRNPETMLYGSDHKAGCHGIL